MVGTTYFLRYLHSHSINYLNLHICFRKKKHRVHTINQLTIIIPIHFTIIYQVTLL